jgi:hypothetical protein
MNPQPQHIPPPSVPNHVEGTPQDSGNGHASPAIHRQGQAGGAYSASGSGAPTAQPLALQTNTAGNATHAVPSPIPPEGSSGVSDIDKEWVEKARNIVWQTRSDPYTQSNEISKLKAEYLRVRFDRPSNVTEEGAV